MSGDYIYERLSPDRFQTFVSSLLVSDFPDFQVWPVGQADGGRDGTVSDGQDRITFQVKFKRELRKGDDYYKWLTNAVKEEIPKIERLVGQGTSKYVLVTNVPGTGKADTGTMDKVQTFLDQNVPVPAQCLWRADLDSRLNGNYDLKWFFSELMASADILRSLITEGLGEGKERRDSAISGYMREQYRADSQVKFKQAELQATDLFDLFVDVPAHVEFSPREDNRLTVAPELIGILRDVAQQESTMNVAPRGFRSDRASLISWGHATGGSRQASTRPLPAASILLHPDSAAAFGRTVVEGAPGQGKSTLAQYLCQVHRMRILGEEKKLARIPIEHAISSSRVPFKVDLRDLSLWLDGFDHRRKLTQERHEKIASLETFLAHEVQTLSGGQDFDASDLYAVAKRLPLLIVLDGFDEVATPKHRAALIEEVDASLERLQVGALSIQVVVTSRPSAIPNAPRFSPEGWNYLSLDAIPRPLALKYAEQWGTSRQLEPDEMAEVIGTLAEKLQSPHLRDLARNPMQLTILLTLIHLRGSSLPDQRTALYSSYIDVFFNREAEKTAVVRDHRQLLIDLHAYLAWKMHGAAEESALDGRILTGELRQAIRDFLSAREYSPDIVDSLFEGVIQRVVALVSRTEGTFEFEVQPLREYFAAHHLYHTSPYSPPGSPVKGTKPEILQALIANPYWQNVLRFFAGFYSVGEIPGLASDLISVLEDRLMPRPSYHRRLALNLLRDWVFHQSPLWTKRLIDAAVDPLTLRLAGEGPYTGDSDLSIQLPSECGGPRAARRALDILPKLPTQMAATGLVSEIVGSLDAAEVETKWWEWVEASVATPSQLLDLADRLGVASGFDLNTVDKLSSVWPEEQDLDLRLCAIGGRPLYESRKLREQVEQRILDCEFTGNEIGYRWQGPVWTINPYFVAPLLVNSNSLGFQPPIELPDGDSWSSLMTVARAVERSVKDSGQQFSVSPEPWQGIIDALDSSGNDPFVRWLFGCMSAAIVNSEFRGAGAKDLWDESVSLTVRCRHARFRAGSTPWWVKQLDACDSEKDRHKWAAVLLVWANRVVKSNLGDELDSILNSMSYSRYRATVNWFSAIHESTPRSRGKMLMSPINETSWRRNFAMAMNGTQAEQRRFVESVDQSGIRLPENLQDELLGWRISWIPEEANRNGWGAAISAASSTGLLDAKLVGISSFSRSYPPSAGGISPEVARSCIHDAFDMPVSALRAADWKLSRGRPETPLATIARKSGWQVD